MINRSAGSMNSFLDLVCRKIHKGNLKFPYSYNYIIESDVNQPYSRAEINFRTKGCKRRYQGGCTMCCYWLSDTISAEEIVQAVNDALSSLSGAPNLLILNPFGSMFDDWEVPPIARGQIFKSLARFTGIKIVFETRADSITKEKISECATILAGNTVEIELGIESSNKWIRKYCINKSINHSEIVNAVNIIKAQKLKPVANILLGTPFLDFPEMILDATSSINWCLNNGFERCVLFPLNIKPWTLVSWLKNNDLYQLPSLWAIVNVLELLETRFLRFTEVVWYKSQISYSPNYQPIQYAPTTCPICYKTVVGLFDEYSTEKENRVHVLAKLTKFQCECKEDWNNKKVSNPIDNPDLNTRIETYYRYMGLKILGESWWEEHGQVVINEIEPFFIE